RLPSRPHLRATGLIAFARMSVVISSLNTNFPCEHPKSPRANAQMSVCYRCPLPRASINPMVQLFKTIVSDPLFSLTPPHYSPELPRAQSGNQCLGRSGTEGLR